MLLNILSLALLPFGINAAILKTRLDDGVAGTPPMGWNTYNHYSCSPNEKIVRSNAKALVDLGLEKLGYRYVTTDCGWTVANRLANGSLTWNETLFPSGFPALGEYIHDLGLLFGVYEDAGIKTCTTGIEQAGSLDHEEQDAATFMSWNVDSLKYDNCYSDEATGYPNTNYAPSISPRLRYANMTKALAAQSRKVLFQICEWGLDFPALWAPSLGHTWRIGNDIIPAWRSIFRTLNQAVPQTSFAGRGQWPDLDMLEVGNNVFTTPEEQTHFSMWAILKSPLVIGAALKDELTQISDASLSVLSNKDVIAFNQDSLGQSASLRRRWTEQAYEVWSGPLSGGRTVVALINWANEARDLTLNLPDVGLQTAGTAKDVWKGKTVSNVKTSYSSSVEAHGVMLLELRDTTPAGVYPSSKFGTRNGIPVGKSAKSVSSPLSLVAGSSNEITIQSTISIDSIRIESPSSTYYPCTSFTLSGSAALAKCGTGFCLPVGSKIGYIDGKSTARASVHATVSSLGTASATSKYLEVDFINNDIALATSWGFGSNTRNMTITLNGGDPVRLEVPLTGRHSELFGPGLGWWDSSTLGIVVDGWKNGDNEVIIGNVAAGNVFQSYGADFVGLRLYN
ncbi:hypothetical protein N7499_008010 [Penicillium canescens]|nr:hypothetical protein N7499_008010 [Penicillium canescens]